MCCIASIFLRTRARSVNAVLLSLTPPRCDDDRRARGLLGTRPGSAATTHPTTSRPSAARNTTRRRVDEIIYQNHRSPCRRARPESRLFLRGLDRSSLARSVARHTRRTVRVVLVLRFGLPADDIFFATWVHASAISVTAGGRGGGGRASPTARRNDGWDLYDRACVTRRGAPRRSRRCAAATTTATG